MRRMFLPALAGLLVATAGGAARAEEGRALPGVFGEVIEVRVINLEVVVTDRDGVRVPGLGKGDFRLLVDGEEVPIDYFTEVRGGVAVEGATPGTEVPALSPGKPVGTSYLLFVDDYFSIARDRDRVLKRLRDDLARLGPEDRMAVVSYDGRKLAMLSSWSQRPDELAEAIDRAIARPALGLQRLAERKRYDLDEILLLAEEVSDGAISSSSNDTRLTPEERSYAGQLADQVQRSVAAATATLRSFAAPPGRKVMLLLSGGWPFLPAEFVVADYSRPIFIEPGISTGDDIFRPLSDTANLLGYTLYPVDVPGLEAQAGVDASRSTPGSSPGVLGASSLRERENHFTLEFLAEKTGGRALINGQRDAALETAAEDTRSYYWLGFTPKRQGDNQRHDVVVEVRNPELRTRSRGGFLDSSRQREVTMAVESALLFGNPPSTIPLELAFGRPTRAGIGKMELPLAVAIPLDSITLVPLDGKLVARLELRIAVIDEAGRQADVPVIPFEIKLDKAPAPGSRVRYDTAVKMRRQRHEVVVAIYDVVGGRILSGSAEVSP